MTKIIIQCGAYNPPTIHKATLVDVDPQGHVIASEDELLCKLEDGRIMPIKKNGTIPIWRGLWWNETIK